MSESYLWILFLPVFIFIFLCLLPCYLFSVSLPICTPEEKGFVVAIMLDAEGSEVHMGELGGVSLCWIFSCLFL